MKTYLAIDLKSFYASVECVERGLDPLKARLVVADPERTDKTICLAVSPALKAYGIPGRPRLFEVNEKARRLGIDFMVAPPRMARYMEVSAQVYSIYLRFVTPEDIHVYSVDEVFIDATSYLEPLGLSAHDFAARLMRTVLAKTGITSTAGIGPNLYLAKVAMDIEAKHAQPDADGVRIASLTEESYRRKYWTHRPLTDFWRLGPGIAARLEAAGLHTLGDVARCSLGEAPALHSEALLYKLFGVGAELVIDHAWGWEPCTLADIKAYKPASASVGSGQVLPTPYRKDRARVVATEMADQLSLTLVERRLLTDRLVLNVHYDDRQRKPVRGTARLGRWTSSSQQIRDSVSALFERIVDASLPVRRLSVVAAAVVREEERPAEQGSLFGAEEQERSDRRERAQQEAILNIRRRFGRNAILRGMDFEEGATTMERNNQIGGHRQ